MPSHATIATSIPRDKCHASTCGDVATTDELVGDHTAVMLTAKLGVNEIRLLMAVVDATPTELVPLAKYSVMLSPTPKPGVGLTPSAATAASSTGHAVAIPPLQYTSDVHV